MIHWRCIVNDLCTIPSNLAGNASASFPVGLAPEDGLPVGLQVMAPPLADDRLYRVGAGRARGGTGVGWGSAPLLDRIFADRPRPADQAFLGDGSRNADVRDREGRAATGAVR